MWFIAKLLGIFLFSSMVAQALSAYQRRKAGMAPPQPFSPTPVATGTPHRVLYGTMPVELITTWIGKVTIRRVKLYETPKLLNVVIGAPQEVSVAWEYEVTLQGVLCWGQITAPINIIFNRTKLLSEQAASQSAIDRVPDPSGHGIMITLPAQSGDFFAIEALHGGRATITYFLPNIFGGDGAGGGFKGIVRYAIGSRQYPADEVMRAMINPGGVDDPDNFVPAYGDLATVVYDQVVVGESPTPPPVAYVVARLFDHPIPDLQPSDHAVHRIVPRVGTISEVTHAGMLYDALRSERYGAGEPAWHFDETALPYESSWKRASAQLRAEGIYGSWLIGGDGQQISVQDVVDEFERVADAILTRDPLTFKYSIKLLRDEAPTDEAFAALPAFTERHLKDLEWHETDPSEVVNVVTVEFYNAEKLWTLDTVTLRNDASIAAIDEKPTTIRFVSITDPAVARILCARELRRLSSRLGRGKFTATRAFWSAERGDVFKLSNDKFGLDERLVRVVSIDYGKPDDPGISVEVVEDMFGHDPVIYSGPDTPPPTSGGTVIAPIVTTLKQTTSGALGTLEFSLVDPQQRVVEVAVKRKSGPEDASEWIVIASASPNTSDPTFPFNDQVTGSALSGTYVTTVALSPTDTSSLTFRVRYIGSGATIPDPLSDVLELTGEVVFGTIRRTGVPTLGFVYSGSDVIVTANAPDASSVKIAGSLTGTPTADDVRATGDITARPFTKTFPAPTAGQVLTIEALAYEGTAESDLSLPLVISGGAPSGTVGTEPVVVSDGMGGFDFVFDVDGNQIFA